MNKSKRPTSFVEKTLSTLLHSLLTYVSMTNKFKNISSGKVCVCGGGGGGGGGVGWGWEGACVCGERGGGCVVALVISPDHEKEVVPAP